MARPVERLDLMRRGEAFFLGRVAALDDEDFAGPSTLPGWSRAHVVAHVARNADALGNLLTWARTGVERPMYPSAEARQAGIEASSSQPAPALRDDLTASSDRLVAATDDLPADAWAAPVKTARGRAITAEEVPWMRIRETWVHAVDLAAGASFADLPAAVTEALIDEVVNGLAGRADCPAVVVHAAGGRTRRIGPDGDATDVEGDGAAILAWLIGRDRGESLQATGGTVPALPPWL
jgi:maleylpyruvate isomerase